MIENFVLKSSQVMFSMPGIRHLDYKKILALPDSEFAALYFEFMNEYKEKDGWWGNAGIPSCSECQKNISGPEQLRRYHGRTLHPDCFKEVYSKDKFPSKDPLERRYFDRIANLPSNIKASIDANL